MVAKIGGTVFPWDFQLHFELKACACPWFDRRINKASFICALDLPAQGNKSFAQQTEAHS